MRTIVVSSFLVLSLSLSASVAKASAMKEFLLTCAYGTAIGAGVGLASLAFSDDPSGKASNIAKGASLGLYAGIGVGLYNAYGKKKSSSPDLIGSLAPVWVTPKYADHKIEGVQAHAVLATF